MDRKASTYLLRHALSPPILSDVPHAALGMIVIIPAYMEPSLGTTLQSLHQCDRSNLVIEVLVVVNHPEDAEEGIVQISKRSVDEAGRLAKKYGSAEFRIHIISLALPAKKAGVGLARKRGMDEAVWRFNKMGKDGIIINLDADCTCAQNYFQSISSFFASSAWDAAGIYFEHSLNTEGDVLSEAIMDYELHLRYFVNAQLKVGLPFAHHTVGSSMAVRSSAYQRMGGMNSRKAGEDFYFLQKFIAVGTFGEILSTVVFPSARSSQRVPFGTGKAVGKIVAGEAQQTYALQSFLNLEGMSAALDDLYKQRDLENWSKSLAKPVQSFFVGHRWPEKLSEILRETSTRQAFYKRFYQNFNAFQLMKYVHFCRKWYADQPVFLEARKLSSSLDSTTVSMDRLSLLQWYRERDRARR